jgi:hypothetical protein
MVDLDVICHKGPAYNGRYFNVLLLARGGVNTKK